MAIKTLHITNAYHPASGGIRTFYRAMLAAANLHGRELRLVVPAEQTRVERVGDFGRIYHVEAPRAPIVDSRYRLILPPAYLRPGGAVARILEKERPDLIEVCDKYALCYLAGLLRREWSPRVPRPTLVGLSCERLDDNLAALMGGSRLAHRLARWYIGRVYAGQFDYHVANSEYTARELREGLVTKHWREVHVVPMGVELQELGAWRRCDTLRAAWTRALGASADCVWLVYAGRIAKEKNLGLLIDMLESLSASPATASSDGAAPRDVRLVIAGDGPEAAALRRAAEQRVPGRVLFAGHVPDRAALARIYASADVFVHPNPREPFGIGPLEAMASGVPLVAPNAGGVLSYASEENAWLAAPTGAAFAAAVRDAARGGDAAREQRRAARVSRARETAEAFGWNSVTRLIFELYDSLHARRTLAGADRPDHAELRERSIFDRLKNARV